MFPLSSCLKYEFFWEIIKLSIYVQTNADKVGCSEALKASPGMKQSITAMVVSRGGLQLYMFLKC